MAVVACYERMRDSEFYDKTSAPFTKSLRRRSLSSCPRSQTGLWCLQHELLGREHTIPQLIAFQYGRSETSAKVHISSIPAILRRKDVPEATSTNAAPLAVMSCGQHGVPLDPTFVISHSVSPSR